MVLLREFPYRSALFGFGHLMSPVRGGVGVQGKGVRGNWGALDGFFGGRFGEP